MTGEEYLHLTDGDLCKLTEDIDTNGLIWHKGDIIEVVFRNSYKEAIYVKNKSVTFNNRLSYKELGALFFFKAMELYKKWNEVKKNTFVTRFEHTFSVGDKFWIMKDNKPISYTIREIQYIMTEKGNKLLYFTESPSDDNSTYHTENEMYSTKEELLKSFL